jgi:hypothetical protein
MKGVITLLIVMFLFSVDVFAVQKVVDPVSTASFRDVWLPWIQLSLVVGAWIYMFSVNKNINSKIRRVKSGLEHKLESLKFEKSQGRMSTAEIESLISASPVLKKVKEECGNLRTEVEKLQYAAPNMLTTAPVESYQSSTFYMTGPTSNYFPSSARSDNRENTVYKFTLQPGGNEAWFELHTTGASINEIIKVIESYIKPACDEENLPFNGTRSIATVKQGVAILENEKWIIKNKAVIRYE